MRSSKDYLSNIEQSGWNLEESAKNIEQSTASAAQSAAQNNKILKGIAFDTRASMVFNGITAANTARQAKTQKEQFALQQEQHALQQEMAEQTARHEFSMWRQTPEGTAFVDWQERAAALIPFLRGREQAWEAAWAEAIGRAQAETSPGEKQRFMRYPERLKQSGFTVASIVSFSITGLFIIILLFQLIASSLGEAISEAAADGDQISYEECMERASDPDDIALTEADCEAIAPESTGPGLLTIVPLVLFAGLGVTFLVMRKVRQRAARTDATVRNEAEARIAKWGFDPLTTQGAWYPWHESQGFVGYADHIGQMVYDGPAQRPQPSQLIQLKVPTPWAPNGRLPHEVNNVLDSFQRENESFSQ